MPDDKHSINHPPKVKIKLCLITEFSPDRDWSTAIIEVSLMVEGDRTVTIQTRGPQDFLHSQSTAGVESNSFNDCTTRALDALHNSFSGACFQIANAETGRIVWEYTAPHPAAASNPPSPPLVRSATTTLFPGETVSRRIPLDRCTRELPDGSYELCLVSRGCWWCEGEVQPDSQGRVPEAKWVSTISPLVLESEDVISFRMEKGIVLGESDTYPESSDESEQS